MEKAEEETQLKPYERTSKCMITPIIILNQARRVSGYVDVSEMNTGDVHETTDGMFVVRNEDAVFTEGDGLERIQYKEKNYFTRNAKGDPLAIYRKYELLDTANKPQSLLLYEVELHGQAEDVNTIISLTTWKDKDEGHVFNIAIVMGETYEPVDPQGDIALTIDQQKQIAASVGISL